MKVEDILKLIPFNQKIKLIGAKTGKTLYKSGRNKNLVKFKSLDAYPEIRADFNIQHDRISETIDKIEPIILLYVSGL